MKQEQDWFVFCGKWDSKTLNRCSFITTPNMKMLPTVTNSQGKKLNLSSKCLGALRMTFLFFVLSALITKVYW